MPLTLPNLDDRSYADLVEEARGLLVTYAPTLTNHNPSDPVVTLAELFAYFTEILLFRVNYVNDASRTAFLRLLNGPTWQAPEDSAELDAEVERTVLMLRRADRAVTPKDFENLAYAADAGIVRAHCAADRDFEQTDALLRQNSAPGHVSVIVVPKSGVKIDDARDRVAQYLAPRRLLTTRVHVVGPRLVKLRVRLTVRLLPEARATAVHDRIMAAFVEFFDPIVGHDGAGWPFGRSVHVSEIYRLIDALPGVDFVTRTLGAGGQPLDELTLATPEPTRLTRNAAGELIGLSLAEDELVDPALDPKDITIEVPPIVF